MSHIHSAAADTQTVDHAPVVEPDRPNNLVIAALVLATVAAIAGIILAVDSYFTWSVHQEQRAKAAQGGTEAVEALRRNERARLTEYRWVDEEKGIVRIPLDRAIELTVRDWETRPVPPAPGN